MDNMEDSEKTREELIHELEKLHQQVAKLKESKIKRKKVEEDLKKSQQEFACLFKSNPQALVYVDKKGNILDINPNFTALFGYSLKEIKGRNIDDGIVTSPDKMKEAKKLTNKALKEDFYFETIRKKKNGTLFSVAISGSRVIIGGRFKGLIASYRDITERQKLTDDLKNSEEKYRTLYENMPGVFYRTDKEGNLLMVNPPGARLLGYHSSEEIIGKNIAKDIYYIPEDRKNFLDELKKRKGTVKDYKVVLKKRNGTPVDVSTSSHYYYDSEGNIAGVEGIFIDITDRKEAERAIIHEQNLLHAFMENISDYIYFKDKEKRFVRVNKAKAEQLNMTLEKMIGKTDFDFYPQELAQQSSADDDLVIETGKSIIDKVEEIVHSDKTKHWVSTTKVPWYNREGKVTGLIGVSRDITERIQNEKLQQVLFNISKAANSPISLDQFYPIIHQELGTIIDTSNFYIALVDEKENKLYFPYYIDELEDDFKPQKLEEKSLTCYIIKNRRSILLNYDKIKKLKKKGELLDTGVITKNIFWFGVPLWIEDKVIGVMTIQSYSNSNPYSEKDTTLLEFVSSQVATAIERKRVEDELKRLAHYDILTGAYNRGYGLELFQRQLKLAKRNKSSLLLAYTDLDNLKEINDDFSHEEGDRVMVQVAKLFKSTLREVDIITRMGGDEFLVILLGCSLNEIPIIRKRLSKGLTRLNKINNKPYKIGFSTGFSNYDPVYPLSMNELIRIADEKMYEEKKSKNKGR